MTDARDMLESLRWDVDQIITNYDGERVWLGPASDDNGKRIGITDCCPEERPCTRHEAIANGKVLPLRRGVPL